MRFHVTLLNCEIRRVTPETYKGSKQYRIRIENEDGEPLEVSCRDEQYFPVVEQLRKTDIVDIPVLIMATSEYQFIALDGAPSWCEGEEA